MPEIPKHWADLMIAADAMLKAIDRLRGEGETIPEAIDDAEDWLIGAVEGVRKATEA